VTTTSDRRKRDEGREHHDETLNLTEAEIQARLEAVEKERDDAKEVCELVEAQCGDWKRRALNAEAALDIFLAAVRTEALRAARDEINEWRPTDINSAAQSGYVDCLSDVWNELTYRAEGGGS
jgi:hypothetical protein